MFISNRGECDVTFKINKERFTFPFLCLDQLSQWLILGHNFSKVFHIGMLRNTDDVMSLTRNGVPHAETLPTHDINTLVLSSISYPGQKENCTLAGVVCLNPHSNTDLYTQNVIQMIDWWLWMILLQVQVSLILWWPISQIDTSKSTVARPWACFILVRTAKSAQFMRLWTLAETPGKQGMTHLAQTPQREISTTSPQEKVDLRWTHFPGRTFTLYR